MNKSEDKDITDTIHFIVGFYLGTAQEYEYYCYEDEKPKLTDVEKKNIGNNTILEKLKIIL